MFNKNSAGKIKNSKIERWRIELSSFEFHIQYRPGKDNVPADALSRICGATYSKFSLQQIHENLCHPGIRRLYHYVRNKNLPYSMEDVKLTYNNCVHCRELKPHFLKPKPCTLVKATRPLERVSIDFMGPKASCSNNNYILTIIDEYSRFPFAFPCADMSADTVIRCLECLFTLCGTPEAIHSDRGTQFMSEAVLDFLKNKNVARTRTSPYNPAGNGQCEKYNGTIWKAVMLVLKSRGMKETQWEQVLPDVLHSIRSLLCTATNSTPHERFFNFDRRSTLGLSSPSWFYEAKTVLVRRHVRPNKNDPLVDKADLLQVNPNYVVVRLPSGRETSVSLRDIAPYPQEKSNNLGILEDLQHRELESGKEKEATKLDNTSPDNLSGESENEMPNIEDRNSNSAAYSETGSPRRSKRSVCPPKRMY
jgi:transposase InsO family protein